MRSEIGGARIVSAGGMVGSSSISSTIGLLVPVRQEMAVKLGSGSESVSIFCSAAVSLPETSRLPALGL